MARNETPNPKPNAAVRLFDAPPPEPPSEGVEEARARLPVPRLPPGRAERVAAARAYLARGRALLRQWHEAGASGRLVVRLHALLVDRLLRAAWEPALAGGASLVALGGYGRSEMAPFSDVDLLFLYEPEGRDRVQPAVEEVLYLLWDSGLKVGHAVRTIAESVEIAEADHTARTALLDCRFVAGDRALYDRFERSLLGELHSRRVEAFLRDKLEEWKARHGRFGQTVFRLEPDVKSGEGGLRDLHTALWVARVVYHAAGVSQLVRRGLLPPGEAALLRAARDFLWRVRNGLHYRAGRACDLLTFDMQEALAASFGYRDRPLEGGREELAVERFMRDYYLSARTVLRISRQLIERAVLEREQGPYTSARGRRVAPGFKVWRDRLTVEDPRSFGREPLQILRVFEVAEQEGVPLYGHTRNLIREAVARLPPDWNVRPEIQAAVRRLFTRPGTRGAFLRDMHETGVLAALVPEFGRQVGLWQHDLYHTYTVDVHSLFAVQQVYALREGAVGDERLRASLHEVEEALFTLLLGTWFHDIGKGLGGGHSEKGAQMMPKVCHRLGCTREEARDVEWLVRMHLTMSRIAQRRDLSDPQLIASYARQVGSLLRLNLLYVLTYADMSTTGENTWSDWKAMLVGELYEKTRRALIGRGMRGRRRGGEAEGEMARLRRQLASRLEEIVGRESARRLVDALPERYLSSAAKARVRWHARMLERVVETAAPQIRRVHHAAKGYTELIVAAPDRGGLLADLTGTFAGHGLDILGAHVFSLRDGRVLDVFLVRDPGEGPLTDARRWAKLRGDLLRAVGEPGYGHRQVEERRRRPGLGRRPEPAVPVDIRFDDRASPHATVVDLFARDRIGLLHDVTRAIAELGLEVQVALVATEAHRATDAFYVTTPDGRKVESPEVRAKLEAALRRAAGTA